MNNRRPSWGNSIHFQLLVTYVSGAASVRPVHVLIQSSVAACTATLH